MFQMPYIVLPKAPLFQPKIVSCGHFPTITISCLRYPSELIDTYKCPNVQMSAKYHTYGILLPGKSPFPWSHPSGEVPGTFPTFHFPGSNISREFKFPRKSNFPGSQISREVIFPGKPNFPGSQIPGKSDETNVRMSKCPNVRKIPYMSRK